MIFLVLLLAASVGAWESWDYDEESRLAKQIYESDKKWIEAQEDFEYDPARDYTLIYKNRTGVPIGVLTTTTGAPVCYKDTETLNKPLILNHYFMETITNLVTKKIPDRLVHSKGTGAFGYFIVTHDFTKYCKANFLSEIGKKTRVGVRFSTTQGEKGTPDLSRDVRGFSVKFYTEEGNFDLPGLNVPTYFYKDPILFRSFVQGRRVCERTNLKDAHTAWDLLSLQPESLHTFLTVFSDRSIPASYSNMQGHGIHTYQLVNCEGVYYFCKFYFGPHAGLKTLKADEAIAMGSTNPDFLAHTLFRDIEKGDCPKWTLSAQVLTMDDVNRLGPDVFDVTKTISLKEFPRQPIGHLVLNENPKNSFAQVEQMAFCPGNLVNGIVGAPDKVFESRVLAYRAAQIHRLGSNFNKIPVNCPLGNVLTYNRGGVGPVGDNEGSAPNYTPNSFNGPVAVKTECHNVITIKETKPNNFKQAGDLYNEMSEDEKSGLVKNLSDAMKYVTRFVKERMVKRFYYISKDLSNRMAERLNVEQYSYQK